jgi:hypothetical protein
VSWSRGMALLGQSRQLAKPTTGSERNDLVCEPPTASYSALPMAAMAKRTLAGVWATHRLLTFGLAPSHLQPLAWYSVINLIFAPHMVHLPRRLADQRRIICPR